MIKNVKYKLLRRLTVSFIVIISITIFILCNILYFIFQSATVSDISSYSANNLKWKSSEVEAILEQVNRISFQLMSKNEVTGYLSGQSVNKQLDEFKMTIPVKDIYTMYPFISSIEIFNSENDVYYNTLNFTKEAVATIKNSSFQISRQSFQTGMSYSHRIMEDISPNPITNTQNVISFLINDYVNKHNSVIINVHVSYIMNKIGIKPTEGSELFLINHEKEVISGTNELSSSDSDCLVNFQKVYDDEGQGYYTKSPFGKHLINYIKLPAFDWYLVNVTQANFVSGGSFEFFLISNIVAFIMLIFGGGLTAFIGRNVYAPIIRVIEKINNTNGSSGKVDEIQIINNEIISLSDKAEYANRVIYKTQDVVKKHILISLLEKQGVTESQDSLFFNENLKYLQNPENSFQVVFFKLDNFDKLSNNHSMDDLELFLYGICNIITEILSLSGICEVIRLSPDVVCSLVTIKPFFSESPITRGDLHKIITSVKSYIGYSISSILGDKVDSIREISKSFASCNKYLLAQYFLGFECIIDRVTYEKHNNSKNICEYNYDKNILSLLFSKNDYEQIVLNVNAFMEEIKLLSYSYAKTQINLFVDELKKLLLTRTEFLRMSNEEIDVTCKNMKASNTVYVFADQLLELSDLIYVTAFAQKTTNTFQKHYDMVNEIKDYVNANYSDAGLSLNQIAGIISVSPGYVGKIFSSFTQQSLVQYILQVRIENAKILLDSTNLPVFEISKRVGILSHTYFTTLFKNSVGLTPSSYREKNQQSF